MFSRLVKQMAKREGVTETLKAKNPMTWVEQMNSIRIRAAEIIYADLDMEKVPMSRMEFDVCGHYALPDVLELRVHEEEGKNGY